MPVIPAEQVHAGPIRHSSRSLTLLAGQTLLDDTPDHLIQVVDVLKAMERCWMLTASISSTKPKERLLNPFPVLKYLDGDVSPAKLWRHFWHDRINFEYAEYCMKAMLAWHQWFG